MKKSFIVAIILLLVVIVCVYFFFVHAKNVKGEATLSWAPSSEVDLKGYRIYYGDAPRTDSCPDGGYKNKIDAGNLTNYSIRELDNHKTYYFSVTAYNTSEKESCFSEEMHKDISIKYLDIINKLIN